MTTGRINQVAFLGDTDIAREERAGWEARRTPDAMHERRFPTKALL